MQLPDFGDSFSTNYSNVDTYDNNFQFNLLDKFVSFMTISLAAQVMKILH